MTPITITFNCSGFSPNDEKHIKTVLIHWMEERGLFEKTEGRPIVEVIDPKV